MINLSLFKQDVVLKNRIKESSRLLGKYPDRVPIIIERSENSKHLTLIDKNKFLVPTELSMSQLLWVIRKLFAGTEFVLTVYENNKDPDGFLYLRYANENTFG